MATVNRHWRQAAWPRFGQTDCCNSWRKGSGKTGPFCLFHDCV